MLKQSDVIVLVDVIEGGTYLAKVRRASVFKGQPPAEFYVTGFNNHNWPDDAIEKESFRTKERHYLFLRPPPDSVYLDFLSVLARDSRDAGFISAVEKAKSSTLLCTWTPTAGDLRLEKDKVHCSLLKTSYSKYGPPHDLAKFEEFLRAAIAYQQESRPDSDLVEHTLQSVRVESARPSRGGEKDESELAHSLASYYLLGGSSYDEAFPKIAESDDVNARFILARLLGRVVQPRAEDLLIRMLSDANTIVQGEVVRQLSKRDPERAGVILLAHLSDARGGGLGPQGIMDPVRNRLDGGTIETVRALGELKFEPAAPALIELLGSTTDADTVGALLEALEKLGRRDYIRALDRCLRNPEAIRVVAQWARNKHLTELRPALEKVLESPPNLSQGGVLMVVIDALGAIGDETTAAALTAHLREIDLKEKPGFYDDSYSERLIRALAALRYKAARDEVERAFFYWFGIDSTFARNPKLLEMKQRIEHDIEQEAAGCFHEFEKVEAHASVWLKNRVSLVENSAATPDYEFAVQVDIRSLDHPELTSEALAIRLARIFADRHCHSSVTRWQGRFGRSSGHGDPRVKYASRSFGFLYSYAEYVQATRDPKDIRFVNYLLQSGLAEKWNGRTILNKALKFQDKSDNQKPDNTRGAESLKM